MHIKHIMRGLYILGNPHLDDHHIIKIGMSMRLQERLFDYDAIFTDNKYHFCYVTKTLTKEQILYIEKKVLIETKEFRNKKLSSEYRNFDDNYNIEKYNNLIINTLEEFKIEYDIMINPEFPKPKKIKSHHIETLDRTDELEELKNNPFNLSKREKLQSEYLDEIIVELDKNGRVLCIAPTGFGKTVTIFQLISVKKYLRIIIFTPRRILNKQTIDTKYTHRLKTEYNYVIFNGSSEKCKK